MHYLPLGALLFILISLVICRPTWIGDENGFMKEFVNHEFLNVLGVILAITLASLAQAHLSLNKIEERHGKAVLDRTRSEVKEAASYLIWLFIAGFAVVFAKPLPEGALVGPIFNAASIFILGFYLMVLYDVTIAVFSIRADVDD